MKMHRRKRNQRGFTLIEASISIGLIALIFICVMNLFVTAARGTIAATAGVQASQDSSNAMQHIIQVTREASWLALPDDSATCFTAQSGHAISEYETTLNGYTIDTAILITSPATGTAISVGGYSGTVSVLSRDADGANLLIYRSDTSGTPNAASGTCLWETGTDNGIVVNQALVKSIATAPDAVQFARPASGSGVVANQVEIKITCGFYNPIHGSSTNEGTNGTQTTTVTGKCVLLRDSDTGPSASSHNPTSTPSTSGAHWQAY